jgi:hypothetical protein
MTATSTPIHVPYPQAEDLILRLSIGACNLNLTGGATDWVEGTYRDPSGQIPLVVEGQDGGIHIRQSPDFESVLGIFQGAPTLRLAIGAAHPFALRVESGANEIELELGGVPLTEFDLRHGAGKVELDFEAPNPEPMRRMRLVTGAGFLEAEGLANAGFEDLVVEGGAAKLELDFGGRLVRNASAKVTTGAAGVDITIPADTSATVTAKAVLGGVVIGDGLLASDGGHATKGALEGIEPLLTIDASVAVGSLRITTN